MIKKYCVLSIVSLLVIGCTNSTTNNHEPTKYDEEKMQETRDRVLK